MARKFLPLKWPKVHRNMTLGHETRPPDPETPPGENPRHRRHRDGSSMEAVLLCGILRITAKHSAPIDVLIDLFVSHPNIPGCFFMRWPNSWSLQILGHVSLLLKSHVAEAADSFSLRGQQQYFQQRTVIYSYVIAYHQRFLSFFTSTILDHVGWRHFDE